MDDWKKFATRFLCSKDDLDFLHEYQIVAFIFGAISSIARQSIQISENKSAEEAEGAFIAITVLYLVASIAVLAVKILALYLKFLKLTEKRQSVRFVVCVHFIPSTLMLVSSLFYYLGDNLGNFIAYMERIWVVHKFQRMAHTLLVQRGQRYLHFGYESLELLDFISFQCLRAK